MHEIKLKVSTILLLIFGFTVLQGQEAITASGGNVSGSGGSVSYSVGQVAYTTNAGTTGSEAQGVQQPYEISVVSGIEEATSINLICSVYPNPATDFLTLKVKYLDMENPSYQLCDINGKLIENKIIEGNETSINMGNLAPSTYILKVIQNSKELKTYKIVKN
jgi:hypothetical protein